MFKLSYFKQNIPANMCKFKLLIYGGLFTYNKFQYIPKYLNIFFSYENKERANKALSTVVRHIKKK